MLLRPRINQYICRVFPGGISTADTRRAKVVRSKGGHVANLAQTNIRCCIGPAQARNPLVSDRMPRDGRACLTIQFAICGGGGLGDKDSGPDYPGSGQNPANKARFLFSFSTFGSQTETVANGTVFRASATVAFWPRRLLAKFGAVSLFGRHRIWIK